MSYDFSVAVDTGGPEPHCIEPFFDDEHPAIGRDGMVGARCGNYTSNVSSMWARCLTGALDRVDPELRPLYESWCGNDDRRMREQYEGQRDRPIRTDSLCLNDLADKPAGELVPLLAAAVEWGIEHLGELHEDDSENGWGDADGAVTYLWDIQRACEAHPHGRLYISS